MRCVRVCVCSCVFVGSNIEDVGARWLDSASWHYIVARTWEGEGDEEYSEKARLSVREETTSLPEIRAQTPRGMKAESFIVPVSVR